MATRVDKFISKGLIRDNPNLDYPSPNLDFKSV